MFSYTASPLFSYIWGNLPFTLDKLRRSDNQRFFSVQLSLHSFCIFVCQGIDLHLGIHALNFIVTMKMNNHEVVLHSTLIYYHSKQKKVRKMKKLVLLQFPGIRHTMSFSAGSCPTSIISDTGSFVSLGIDYLCSTASGVTWYLTPVYVFKPFSLKKF